MSEFDKDRVSAYYEYGVDVENRRVFIGDISPESVDRAIKGLYIMGTESETTPCEMFISSDGGTIYETLALYDIMNTLPCPIHTFAYGCCMSSALLLLSAGEPGHRWVAPHVSLLHHDWATEIGGKGVELAAYVKHNEQLSKIWTELLTKHSTQTFKWWDQKAKKAADFYFSAEQATEWGIADHIWIEKE